MDFPIESLIDEEQAQAWVLNHFHPQGLCCPKCQARVLEARNFLRPFRGVHKKFLAGYIAICAFVMNLKSVSVDFISKLVKSTYS